MPFNIQDLQDLLRLLDEHPEWREPLRARLLHGELLELPALVRQLAEAQSRTEERLGRVVERLGELAEAQLRTEARLDQLVTRVDQLAEAQLRTEVRLDQLAAAQQEMSRTQTDLTLAVQTMGQKVDQLAASVGKLTEKVGDHDGQLLELEYIRKAPGRFGRIARRPHVLAPRTLVDRLDDAVDDGRLTWEERNALLNADIVAEGRLTDGGADVYLLVEVSAAIDEDDIRRALERSRILSKLGRPAVPVTAGRTIGGHTDLAARSAGVWRVIGGRAIAPDEPAW